MVPNVPDVVTFNKKAEEVFVTMRTAGVVTNVLDVVTFKSLGSKKAEDAFETIRTARRST